jgi:hypothetical protein
MGTADIKKIRKILIRKVGKKMESEIKIPVYKKLSRFIYALIALILFASIITQTLFAGMSLFGSPEYWNFHKTFAAYIDKQPALMFILSFIGGIKGRRRWLSFGLYALISFQYMSVYVFSKVWLLASFHTVNALLLFWGSMYLMKKSWSWLYLLNKKI